MSATANKSISETPEAAANIIDAITQLTGTSEDKPREIGKAIADAAATGDLQTQKVPVQSVQFLDGWIEPAHNIRACRVVPVGNRWQVEVKLWGEGQLDPPHIRSVHIRKEDANEDAWPLIQLYCDSIMFAPQPPPEPVYEPPQRPDPNPLARYEGHNMGTYSGWQEDPNQQWIVPENQQPPRQNGYGTGRVDAPAQQSQYPPQQQHPFVANNQPQPMQQQVRYDPNAHRPAFYAPGVNVDALLSKPASALPPGVRPKGAPDPETLRQFGALGGFQEYPRGPQ